MPNSRLLNYLRGFLFLICFLCTAGFTLAQTPTPSPSTPKLPADPNGFSAQFDSSAIGITCGLPESLNRSDGIRCCNTTFSSGNTIKKPEDIVPKFFCLSGIPGMGVVEDIVDVGCDVTLGLFCDSDDQQVPDACLSDAVYAIFGSSPASSLMTGVSDQASATAVPQPCIEGAEPTSSDYASASCKCVPAKADANGVSRLCSLYMTGSFDKQTCTRCASRGGYWTGIGCMKTDIAGFAGSIIGVGMGIGGAATFLCIIYAAFILQTSRGNPEKIKKAQESLRACISGLLLIIFSIFLLRLIGVTILQIPGLS